MSKKEWRFRNGFVSHPIRVDGDTSSSKKFQKEMTAFVESFYYQTNTATPIFEERERMLVRGICKEIYNAHDSKFRSVWKKEARAYHQEMEDVEWKEWVQTDEVKWFSSRFPTIDITKFYVARRILGDESVKKILLHSAEQDCFQPHNWEQTTPEQLKEEINNLFTNKKENNR